MRKRVFDLVGESSLNTDGTYRQRILRSCLPGQPVDLVREADNEFDRNAILVTFNRQGIGYISRDDAAILAPLIDGGMNARSRIHELTGGLDGAPSFGCRISLALDDKPFRDLLPLRPEQTFYEHAPVWRDRRTLKLSKVSAMRTPAKRKSVLNLFFRGLFK